jgi:hypothetical protein
MNSYIQLKNATTGVYYYVKIKSRTWHDPMDPNQDIQRTLNHTYSMTFGAGIDRWSGVAKFRSVDAAISGIQPLTVAMLKTWLKSGLYTDRQLTLKDFNNATYSVFITIPIDADYLDPMLHETELPFELLRRA